MSADDCTCNGGSKEIREKCEGCENNLKDVLVRVCSIVHVDILLDKYSEDNVGIAFHTSLHRAHSALIGKWLCKR